MIFAKVEASDLTGSLTLQEKVQGIENQMADRLNASCVKLLDLLAGEKSFVLNVTQLFSDFIQIVGALLYYLLLLDFHLGVAIYLSVWRSP